MPLVAKHLDFVIGVDIHITILPPPATPLPLPYPFMAMIFDPMDWVPMIGASVKVNNMPRAVASTQGMLAVPPLHHIPWGPGFVLEPMIGNDQKMFFGGAKTHAEGALLSAGPYMVMSCNDIGMPLSIKPGKNWKPIPSLYLPLSSSIPLPMGPPVNLNDPLVPDWSSMAKDMLIGAAFGYALKGAGAALKKFNHFLKASSLGDDNIISRMLCKLGFEPVDLVRGNVVSYVTDFSLPGPVPLVWERQYTSNSMYEGSMGARWCTQYHQHMAYRPEEAAFDWFSPDGRSLRIPDLPFGESLFVKSERCTFYHDADGVRYFNHRERLWYHFDRINADRNHYQLVRVSNGVHQISLHYRRGLLQGITDSGGRELLVHSDARGRIIQIVLAEPGNPVQLVAYQYDDEGDLVAVLDTFNKATRISYQNHLMVEKTDRNGATFYWRYDGDGRTAKCTHTFGSDNLMKGRIEYGEGRNVIYDALGNRSELVHRNGLVVEEIDAYGFSKKYIYNESYELIAEEDELGRKTLYAYDLPGNCTATTLPDGGKTAAQYNDDGQPTLAKDAAGGITIYNYDELGNLSRIIYPDRKVEQREYRNGLLHQAITPTGQVLLYEYDSFHNLAAIRYPDGRRREWSYNYAGKCIRLTYPTHAVERYEYDAMGRLQEVTTADDNHIKLEYDAYDNAVRVRDRRYKVEMEYNALGRLTRRVQGAQEIEFFYNNNSELTSVKNEAGESYYFRYNSAGKLIEEMGFDGLKRQYIRNGAGEIITLIRPGGAANTYEYDGAGRLLSIAYEDGTAEYFEYDEAGRLTGAANEYATVRLTRNEGGQVVKEMQDDVVLTRSYNRLGRPLTLESSLGASFKYTYNDWGHLEQMQSSQGILAWQATLINDVNGFELQRHLPGEAILRHQRDKTNKPLAQWLGLHSGQTLLHKKYNWSAGTQLQSTADMQRNTLTTYQYSAEGHLTGSKASSATSAVPAQTLRRADKTGNYYETEDQRDRRYGPGGRLEAKGQATYFYNEEGSLKEKRLADGRSWKYSYFPTGMLREVTRPDGRKVSFTYDALGRRLSKTFGQETTRWVWDGHVPLHEWKEDAGSTSAVTGDAAITPPQKRALVTWMYEPGSFVPCAKITAEGTYSIIADQLGTPLCMIDSRGRKVWEGEVDIYGRLQLSTGRPEDLPFRFQGQYEDIETGLYYNRFRYYSPEEGMYLLQQDPIRIASGKLNLYGYVNDPNDWVDIFGLECKWGDYYKKLSGTSPPEGMTNPHAHHIVFRNGPAAARPYIEDSQRILREAGIDPIMGVENFVWAPNKNHSIEAAKAVNKALNDTVANGGSVKETLGKLGQLFADDNISSIF